MRSVIFKAAPARFPMRLNESWTPHQQQPPNLIVSYTSSWKLWITTVPIPKHQFWWCFVLQIGLYPLASPPPPSWDSAVVWCSSNEWSSAEDFATRRCWSKAGWDRGEIGGEIGRQMVLVNKNDEIPNKRIAGNDKMLGESAKNHVQVWINSEGLSICIHVG